MFADESSKKCALGCVQFMNRLLCLRSHSCWALRLKFCDIGVFFQCVFAIKSSALKHEQVALFVKPFALDDLLRILRSNKSVHSGPGFLVLRLHCVKCPADKLMAHTSGRR